MHMGEMVVMGDGGVCKWEGRGRDRHRGLNGVCLYNFDHYNLNFEINIT